MKWFELQEDERVKQFYSKYSIQDFWNWWSNKENHFMEVRIQDWKLSKETGVKFNIPYSSSGVYVSNGEELKKVIAYVRDKATIWFGVNPRKKNKNLRGWNLFGSAERGGSGDINISEIKYLFLDIDRIAKDGIASTKDLEHCDILANEILKRLETEKWAESYIKIASGHGLQMLIKLDVGLVLPDVEFEKIIITKENNVKEEIHKPIITNTFNKTKDIIKSGIGKDLLTFTKKVIKEKKLLVEIDKSCFRMAQVGALHCSKNFKYDTYRWRGIVEMKDKINKGLSDHIWSRETNEKEFKAKSVFVQRKATTKDIIHEGKLLEHPLIKFCLENEFTYGEINNKLWFQVKCLIRDSKVNLSGEEYMSFVRRFETVIKGKLSPNLPDKKFSFDRNIVNDFCLNQKLPPVYPVYGTRHVHNNFMKEDFDYDYHTIVDGIMSLPKETNLKEDLNSCKDKLVFDEYFNNHEIIAQFIKGIIEKYDEDTAKYLFKYWLYRTIEFS